MMKDWSTKSWGFHDEDGSLNRGIFGWADALRQPSSPSRTPALRVLFHPCTPGALSLRYQHRSTILRLSLKSLLTFLTFGQKARLTAVKKADQRRIIRGCAKHVAPVRERLCRLFQYIFRSLPGYVIHLSGVGKTIPGNKFICHFKKGADHPPHSLIPNRSGIDSAMACCPWVLIYFLFDVISHPSSL